MERDGPSHLLEDMEKKGAWDMIDLAGSGR